MRYFQSSKTLHKYGRFQLSGDMPSTPNTKSLQPVCGTDDARYKLGLSHYYKYRAANLMFGFNTGTGAELNSQGVTSKAADAYSKANKGAQFEIGQPELVQLHHYTYEIDIQSMLTSPYRHCPELTERVHQVNRELAKEILFSTQNLGDYEKLMPLEKFMKKEAYYAPFLNGFMSTKYLNSFAGLGASS
eukprot:841582-Prorocentrum_minimum.AAC.1